MEKLALFLLVALVGIAGFQLWALMVIVSMLGQISRTLRREGLPPAS